MSALGAGFGAVDTDVAFKKITTTDDNNRRKP
jgi:hypothetical protein